MTTLGDLLVLNPKKARASERGPPRSRSPKA